MEIEKAAKLYKYPVLVFYAYYKRNNRSLKEWAKVLDDYRFAEPDNPIRIFVEMMEKYSI